MMGSLIECTFLIQSVHEKSGVPLRALLCHSRVPSPSALSPTLPLLLPPPPAAARRRRRHCRGLPHPRPCRRCYPLL